MQIALLILASALSFGPAATESATRVERHVQTMGTTLRVVVDAPERDLALAAAERAIDAVLAAEARLSTWDPASELSRFNAAPAGSTARLSPQLARDLAAAVRCSETTGGAFSPGMGALVRDWGLREGGRIASDEQIERGRRGARIANLRLTGEQATRVEPAFVVEEGAFGKGAALDDATAALEGSRASSMLLDLGGQVALWGDAGATLEIADPRDRNRTVLRMSAPLGSTATSGNSERPGHILDPRSGRPTPDFGSVTVWSKNATQADCLATGLFVLGPEEAARWASTRNDVAVVVLEVEGEAIVAHASATLRDRLAPLVPELELRWIEP